MSGLGDRLPGARPKVPAMEAAARRHDTVRMPNHPCQEQEWGIGQSAYAILCLLLLGFGWQTFTDFISRGICVMFVVIIYSQLSSGTWNQNARELRRQSDREGGAALRQAYRGFKKKFNRRS